MPFVKTISHEKGIIGLWEITEKSDELIAKVDPSLVLNSNYYNYKSEKRKIEWLVTRIIISEMAGNEYVLNYNENNKPLIKHVLFKHISISHSVKYVAVNLNYEAENGIDIECVSRNFEVVKKRYLSDLEIPDVEFADVLPCLYWCTKEAVFKFVHETEIEFREQIIIDKIDPFIDSKISVKFISKNSTINISAYFLIFDNHCLVWV